MLEFDSLLKNILPNLIAIRHDLHAHPQLAYQETYASGLVQKHLAEWGIPHRAGIAETGVVAWIDPPGAKHNEPAIGLRGDMDALPITEESGLPYASRNPGYMHACGHDGHTTILLGAARALWHMRERLPRPVKLLFQPAEEVGAGAQRMIDEGALSDRIGGRRVAAMFGLHGSPFLPLGWYASKSGPVLAGCTDFEVIVHGRGGHAALPHTTADPIVAAATLITSVQTLISRNSDPLEPAVVSVTGMHGGDATNVVPDTVRLIGTIRAHCNATFERLQKRFRELAESIAAGFACRCDISFTTPFPPVKNDAMATEFAFAIAGDAFGSDKVVRMDHAWMASEDFSYYSHVVPSHFGFIGLIRPGHETHPMLHTPQFDFTDAALEQGIRLMCGYALNAGKLSVV